MRGSESSRVGLTVLAAAALLGAGTFSLKGVRWGRGGYEQKVAFTDARGIQKGAFVRVRGVDVGTVDGVSLGDAGQAILTLQMSDEYRIKPDDAIRISGGVIGFGTPNVEITPGGRRKQATRPGTEGAPGAEGAVPPVMAGEDILTGDAGTTQDELLAKSTTLLENLNRLSGSLTIVTENLAGLMQDPKLRGSLTKTVANLETFSSSGVRIGENMERTTARAERLIAGFENTTIGLDRTLRRVDTLMSGFQGTAAETQALARDARTLMTDTRSVVGDTRDLVRNTNTVVQGAGGLVTDSRAAINENRTKISQLFDNLNGSLKQLDATLAEARSFVGDKEARANLTATTENIREATANLRSITQDVKGVTGDPKVQEDLRATVAGLRDATEEAAATLRTVRGVLGGGGKAAKTIRQRVSETDLDVSVLRTARSARNRVDLDATIPWSDNTFYRLGFYDFGENNRFNVQMGQQVRPGVWGRYGIYASKLGVGLDIGRRERPPFSLNIFGVDRPQVDVRGNLPIGPSLDLTLGLDNIARRADPIIGIRYRK